MRKLLHHLQDHCIAIIAICAFVVLGSLSNPAELPAKNNIAANCQEGYSVQSGKLKQFMLDSLATRRYEGGIYSKQQLLRVLNALPGDSVYLVNGVFGCELSNGTGLAITSPGFAGIAYLGWWGSGYCYPCPLRACCPRFFCLARIDRVNISYLPYNTPSQGISYHDHLPDAAEQ